jgi:cytochrome c oxidase subunit 2
LLPGGLLLLAGAGAGCGSRFGAPDPATSQGSDVLGLWRVLMITGIGVGAVVIGLLAWTIVRHRRPRAGSGGAELPPQIRENIPLEVAYTAVPLVIVAVLFAVTMRVQRPVTRLSANPGLRVEATAFQWGWRFAYPAQDVTVLGDSNTPPTLVLPLSVTTRLELASPDVIHSFYVPSFLQKQDVIPGTTEEIDVTPTRVGRFAGYCAEFCGLDHARMTFDVEVVTQPEFEQWLAERQQEDDDGGADSDSGPDGSADPSGQARLAPPPAARVEGR